MNEPQKTKLSSPQERLELVLLCLAQRLPVTALCREANVSRELCYRWLRAVRKAGLRALEPKKPGPKSVDPEKAPWEVLKLRKRVEQLEKDLKRFRKDRDEWKLTAEMGRRIIMRNAWGPAPEKASSKKNGMRSPKKEDATCGTGSLSESESSGPGDSPGVGGSAGARTGDGPLESSWGPENEG